MFQAIISVIAVVGGLVLWLLRRYVSIPRAIRKMKEKVDDITQEIIQLEKSPHNLANFERLSKLYADRLRLNTRIRRYKGK